MAKIKVEGFLNNKKNHTRKTKVLAGLLTAALVLGGGLYFAASQGYLPAKLLSYLPWRTGTGVLAQGGGANPTITDTGISAQEGGDPTVTDTFDNYDKMGRIDYAIITGGKLKLGGPTYTGITEDTCNAVPGWHWYTTNGKQACWSKTLAGAVWNSGVGDDTDNPGEYTCADDITSLTERMEAASNGEWYKIVSSVNGDDCSDGCPISALAIADCIDRVRDLCTGDGCLGADTTAVNNSLAAWANATGDKSALPLQSDYSNACGQYSGNDLPLGCFDGLFYKNRGVCGSGGGNPVWAAAVYNTTYARMLGGYGSCSYADNYKSSSWGGLGVRVVLRP